MAPSAPDITARQTRWPIVGLLASTGLSVTGNAMVVVLIPWLVLRETGNAAYAGLVNSAALIAGIVSLLIGAAIIDRWDRRNLSVGADVLSAAAVVAIPLVERWFGLTIASIFVLVVIGAVFDGPGRSAREALRPAIAERSGLTLERTNALGEVTDGIGAIAGSAGAGVAVTAVGLLASFWLGGTLLLLAAIVFWFAIGPSRPDRSNSADESYLRTAVDGFKVVWSDPVLRSTAISGALFMFFLAPLVLVFTAEFEAAGRATALGGVLASFSVGSIVGALAYAAVGERAPRRLLMLAGSTLATVGLGIIAWVLDDLWLIVIVIGLTGLAAGPINPIFSVIIQQRTTDAIRGRALTTLGTIEMMAAPLSTVLAGVLIETTSTRVAILTIAAGTALATAFSALTPGLRHIEAADLLADAAQPSGAAD